MNKSELRKDPRQDKSMDRPMNNLIMAGLIVLLALGLGACSSGTSGSQSDTNANGAGAKASNSPAGIPVTVKTKTESVPKSLTDAGEYAENIYDYAKANDWKQAEARLGLLKSAVEKVRTDVSNQKAAGEIYPHVAALDRAVTAKDRQASMLAANQITRDVAQTTTDYKVSVPVEVVLLDYYGRELEIWAEAKDTSKLQATAKEMRQTWDAVRPLIEAKNSGVAKKFEALVKQVEAAKAPADYEKVAKPVLDEVDNLEKVFE
jgi:hypothetical protein